MQGGGRGRARGVPTARCCGLPQTHQEPALISTAGSKVAPCPACLQLVAQRAARLPARGARHRPDRHTSGRKSAFVNVRACARAHVAVANHAAITGGAWGDCPATPPGCSSSTGTHRAGARGRRGSACGTHIRVPRAGPGRRRRMFPTWIQAQPPCDQPWPWTARHRLAFGSAGWVQLQGRWGAKTWRARAPRHAMARVVASTGTTHGARTGKP